MLFTRIALCLKDIFLNVLGMGNNSEKSYSREKMHCTIIPERLGMEFVLNKVSWGRREGRERRKPVTQSGCVFNLVFACVCVFIYMWVYKTTKGLNFY